MLRLLIIALSFISVVLLSGCDGGPGYQAYYRGNAAYTCGNYKAAFANYLYAANEDVVPAQYALGYLFYYGQGTTRDEPKSIEWFQRAAYASPQARYALYLIQQKRPPQPWIYQLKESKQPSIKTTKTY